MSWTDNLKDPVILTVWGGITAALGFFGKEISGYFRAKNDLKKAEIEKEPDRDRIWKDGMVDLFREMKKEIAELREEVADLNEHVDNLVSVLKAHNIAPPLRRRRAATASSEVKD